MHLALRVAYHPLVLGEGGEGCLGAGGPPPQWGSGTLPTSMSWGLGVWEGNRIFCWPLPPAAGGAGVGGTAHPCAGGVVGQGCREPTLGGCTEPPLGIHAMCPCLLAPHWPGGLGATVAALPRHGWFQASCPRGGRAHSLRARQCQAACALCVGPARQMGPLYCVWAAPWRAAPGLSRRPAVAGASAEPCPVTPSWRQRWTWPSGAASARPSGSCSGRSWSGTRRHWHPSASARSVAATGRTTRRTGRGESSVALGPASPPPSALSQGMVASMPDPTVARTDLEGHEGGSSPALSGGWPIA